MIFGEYITHYVIREDQGNGDVVIVGIFPDEWTAETYRQRNFHDCPVWAYRVEEVKEFHGPTYAIVAAGPEGENTLLKKFKNVKEAQEWADKCEFHIQDVGKNINLGFDDAKWDQHSLDQDDMCHPTVPVLFNAADD